MVFFFFYRLAILYRCWSRGHSAMKYNRRIITTTCARSHRRRTGTRVWYIITTHVVGEPIYLFIYLFYIIVLFSVVLVNLEYVRIYSGTRPLYGIQYYNIPVRCALSALRAGRNETREIRTCVANWSDRFETGRAPFQIYKINYYPIARTVNIIIILL